MSKPKSVVTGLYYNRSSMPELRLSALEERGGDREPPCAVRRGRFHAETGEWLERRQRQRLHDERAWAELLRAMAD